ncbi:hypothetical protein [Sulfurimonas hydrogeniphila]|uniref:hypothetical protein n=1 Tax=Sulfurimonas hydrogeniphila TaxID=2509341 RepID=UPI00125F35D3|nr:hypothetical protein [Sulfurimonas hydrogeniphila]
MNTSYAANSYYRHDLNITMKTSSGDVITMDFANEKSASANYETDGSSRKTSMSFSSMSSFKFSIDTNGIDAQDQKEIEAFMKTAQPYIDKFIQELSEDAPKSPVTKLAKKIAALFQPNENNSEARNNTIKTNIVEMFDRSLQKVQEPFNIFKETQKLLEKTLKEFDTFNKELYA